MPMAWATSMARSAPSSRMSCAYTVLYDFTVASTRSTGTPGPASPHRQVVLGVDRGSEVVAAADHGEDVAGGGVDRHDRRLGVGDGVGEDRRHRGLGLRLQVQVDGGADGDAAGEEEVAPLLLG